jgi:hypothetical protein
VGDDVLIERGGPAPDARLCLCGHAREQLLELGDPQQQILSPLAPELGDGGRHRALEPDGGVGGTALVEIQAGPQDQLLAEQDPAAPAHQSRQALLRAQRPGTVAPPPEPAGRLQGQLACVVPLPQ